MTLVAAVVALLLAVLAILRTATLVAEAAAVPGAGPVVLGAWFARQNHFEWMFAPQDIAHVEAGKATFVRRTTS